MRFRALIARPGLVVGGLVAAALLIEIVLQVMAWLFMVTGAQPRAGSGWLTENRRVLCAGDSHTYGLWVRPEQAYPAQLEALWNERVDTPKIEVMNFGYPGTNSSVVATELPDMLTAIRPHALIVMIGANDFWTLPVQADEPAEGLSGQGRSVAERSRFLRLLALLRGRMKPELRDPDSSVEKFEDGRIWVARRGDHELRMGYRRAADGETAGTPRDLRRNLESIVGTAADFGTRLVLLTYPSRITWLQVASRSMRAVAAENGTQLIDLAGVFASRCPDERCAELLRKDNHPTTAGYRLVAETIVEEAGSLAAPASQPPGKAAGRP